MHNRPLEVMTQEIQCTRMALIFLLDALEEGNRNQLDAAIAYAKRYVQNTEKNDLSPTSGTDSFVRSGVSACYLDVPL